MTTDSVAKLDWFLTVLAQEENDAELGRAGSFWTPHLSPEGGEDTLGYGHKLVRGRDENVTILDREFNLFTDKIPHKYIQALLVQDVIHMEKKAAKQWATYQPVKGMKWEDLPTTFRAILTEINFNAGLVKNGKWAWPSLAKAMGKNDYKEILKQLDRSYTKPDGTKVPLTKRVNALKKAYRQAFDSQPVTKEQEVKDYFKHFDKLNDEGKRVMMSRYFQKEQERLLAEEEKESEFATLHEQAEEWDRMDWEALQKASTEKQGDTTTEEEEVPEKPVEKPVEVVDEGYIEQEKLSQVEYFQREDGVIIKMVNGEATEL